ncbi:YfhO family protein [Candidatus Gottesmanbacteria bacterium]|nr:YfhO family protein [Candidatus Gottesmanbacteria bacterium]
MRKKITPYVLPVVLYAVAVVLVFGRALLPSSHQLIFGDDIHHQYFFYREFFNNYLRQGIFSFWNPYNFSGTPFIASPIANIWYPATWLFFLLPLNIAYSWHIALHILWAMVGMYVLLRNRIFNFQFSILNEKQKLITYHLSLIASLPAWVGGLLFGLSGFFMARVWAGHVDVIAAASWMPFVISANLKAQNSKQKKDVVVAAVVLAMQLLAGYQTIAIFTMEVVAVATVFFSFRQRSATPAIRAAVMSLLGIGIAAIQIFPLYEFLSQSIRTIPKPYEWALYGSMTWESLKQLLSPFYFGDQLTYHGPPPNYIEHAAFVGRVGLGLVALVFIVFLLKSLKGFTYYKTKTENIWILIFIVVAVFGLWVSLGPNAPIDLLYILWKFVPIYHSLRIPSRHLILFVFAGSALAAFGLQMVKIRVVQVIIAVLVLIEMVGFARHFIELRPVPETRHDAALIQLLSPPRCGTSFTSGVVEDDCLYRLLQNFGVWISQRDALEFDETMSKRIFSATGYDVAILKSYYEFIDAAAGNRGSSILEQDVQVPYITQFSPWVDFLNIKYIMHPRAYDPLFGTKNDRFTLIREDTTYDYRLYENKTVLPRFFYVSESLVVPTKSDVLSKILDGSVNPYTSVLFENTKEMLPTVSPCKSSTDPSITIRSYTPNRIELFTDNSCNAFMVSSEVYFPGWGAYIDDKKTDIIRGNYAFRTLFVPAGKHMVSYVYRPTIFYVATAVSISTIFILLIWIRKHP